MKDRAIRCGILLLSTLTIFVQTATAQSTQPADLIASYTALHTFMLDGGEAQVSSLILKRDRGEMTFTGTFYFPKPVLGKITGAVFAGEGKFRMEPPPRAFEKENLQRMLNVDVVESDFKTAVLRFTDDTYSIIGRSHEPGGMAPQNAQDLASEIESRTARETGANLASRLLISLVNNENPGVFIAQFDKGSRGRFTLVLDMQCRIPTTHFSINGGEKGLVYTWNRTLSTNDVWLAFHSEQDYRAGTVSYSDAFDQISTEHYDMQVDLREPNKVLKVRSKMAVKALAPVRAISLILSEDLPEEESLRKKKGMRVTGARFLDGTPLQTVQAEWESGLTVLLPALRKTQENFLIEVDVEGDFIYDLANTYDCKYPFVNGEWYPRHGYLSRSKFDISFLHKKRFKVAGPGERVSEEPAAGNSDEVITKYRMTEPVALVTFAMGPYKIYQEKRKLQKGEIPLELFSLNFITVKEDFVLAEMGNALEFLSTMFGEYPYPIFRAAFHPFRFGQGFATMLAIPNVDSANSQTYAFLSHETSHQWWGNVVAWRSYRDQWLSEGFAEYSGILYIKNRTKNSSDVREEIDRLRDSLKEPAVTTRGIGSNRVVDIGPLILGQRLASSKSTNAYSVLTYGKGALVLRMLHFLFTNPSTGDGQAFFDMMSDFVNRYRNSSASTEEFAAVAGAHFARTPLAQKYGAKDLGWFFNQWVMQTALPSYRLEYSIKSNQDGSALVEGTIFQENAPENWVMPLPVVIKFGGNQVARGTVLANGAQQPVSIPLPQKPESVELDPDHWILSDKASTRKR